jgi:hypothetical protein
MGRETRERGSVSENNDTKPPHPPTLPAPVYIKPWRVKDREEEGRVSGRGPPPPPPRLAPSFDYHFGIAEGKRAPRQPGREKKKEKSFFVPSLINYNVPTSSLSKEKRTK